jgi:hypothetical protein
VKAETTEADDLAYIVFTTVAYDRNGTVFGMHDSHRRDVTGAKSHGGAVAPSADLPHRYNFIGAIASYPHDLKSLVEIYKRSKTDELTCPTQYHSTVDAGQPANNTSIARTDLGLDWVATKSGRHGGPIADGAPKEAFRDVVYQPERTSMAMISNRLYRRG